MTNQDIDAILRSQLDATFGYQNENIEVEVSELLLQKIFEITKEQWSKVGETEPFWSVLADEKWLRANMDDERIRAFYESGSICANKFLSLIRRNALRVSNGYCLELGCGVGRVTTHLASLFQKVQAVDISAGNLKVCREHMQNRGIQNVEVRQIQDPGDLGIIWGYDAFFTVMTLQHNPPPIQAAILKALLMGLNSGGVGYFQIVTGGGNYGYAAQQHIEHYNKESFEMHVLPARYVHRIISDRGCQCVEVIRDLYGGYNVDSYTYVVQKR